MEHLVEGHVNGNYYISNSDSEFIEQYCEQCGDSDTILASWNPEEKNARLNALLRFFMESILNTREDIYYRALQQSHYSQWYSVDIISLLISDIECTNDDIREEVDDLHNNNYISDEEFDIIMHISDFEKERQIKMVKYFEKSMFDIDDKTGEKVLKKKL